MFKGPTWGTPGSCRPHVGPMWPHGPCYLGMYSSTSGGVLKWQKGVYMVFVFIVSLCVPCDHLRLIGDVLSVYDQASEFSYESAFGTAENTAYLCESYVMIILIMIRIY